MPVVGGVVLQVAGRNGQRHQAGCGCDGVDGVRIIAARGGNFPARIKVCVTTVCVGEVGRRECWCQKHVTRTVCRQAVRWCGWRGVVGVFNGQVVHCGRGGRGRVGGGKRGPPAQVAARGGESEFMRMGHAGAGATGRRPGGTAVVRHFVGNGAAVQGVRGGDAGTGEVIGNAIDGGGLEG